MKKILILGAGIYQAPLIKKAREMGLYSVVLSIPGNYPGFALADKVLYVDTTDYQKVCEAAREEAVDGICTAGTDVAIVSLGYACEKLGLPGISHDAARWMGACVPPGISLQRPMRNAKRRTTRWKNRWSSRQRTARAAAASA